MKLTNLEKMRVIEWFNHIRSASPYLLDEEDFNIAKKIRKELLESKSR